jgi:hypothetical protein
MALALRYLCLGTEKKLNLTEVVEILDGIVSSESISDLSAVLELRDAAETSVF